MIAFEDEIEIDRPIDEVFAFIADLENIPRWNYAIDRTMKTMPGSIGVGTVYRQHRKLPEPSEETLTVTEYEPSNKLALEGQLSRFEARMSYSLMESARGTLLVNEVELTGSGATRLIAQLAAGRIKSAVADNLRSLKVILESS